MTASAPALQPGSLQQPVVRPVFRFAPSPNGYLHLGHAYSALLNADIARRFGGRLLLRIEDIDLGRSREEYVSAIIEDLDWLGLTFADEPRRQSEHFDDYKSAWRKLEDEGYLFACGCTRGEIAGTLVAMDAGGQSHPRDPDNAPLYPGMCRAQPGLLKGGHSHRLRMDHILDLGHTHPRLANLVWNMFNPVTGALSPHVAQPARWGDALIVRKDVPTSYHLSVVVDDALQGVTHVVRGRDLEPATDLHCLLQALLGLPTPVYHHHDLIKDAGGEKLAKSRLSKPLREWRKEGASPDEIRMIIGLDVAA